MSTDKWFEIDDFSGFRLKDILSYEFAYERLYTPAYTYTAVPTVMLVFVTLTITLNSGVSKTFTVSRESTWEEAEEAMYRCKFKLEVALEKV